jgi:hypothetical protein
MKCKITVSINREEIDFIDRESPGNRSELINRLLNEHRCRTVEQQTIAALQADLADPMYQNDLLEWDPVVGDGIDAQG